MFLDLGLSIRYVEKVEGGRGYHLVKFANGQVKKTCRLRVLFIEPMKMEDVFYGWSHANRHIKRKEEMFGSQCCRIQLRNLCIEVPLIFSTKSFRGRLFILCLHEKSLDYKWVENREITQWFQYVQGTPNKTLSESIKYYFIIIFFPLSNMKFRGLMVRRPAFHTEIWGSIPPSGNFTFFFQFFQFFQFFKKRPMFEALYSLSAKDSKDRTFIK